MSNFQPLEVVGGGSETQLQAGGNVNKKLGRGTVNLDLDHYWVGGGLGGI